MAPDPTALPSVPADVRVLPGWVRSPTSRFPGEIRFEIRKDYLRFNENEKSQASGVDDAWLRETLPGEGSGGHRRSGFVQVWC